MKNLGLSYFFAAVGLISPFSGIHRFYLGKPLSGIFYLLTWGFFGIGTIIDIIRMPTLVDASNYRVLVAKKLELTELSNPERDILNCANRNGGRITVQRVAMDTGMSLVNSKRELEKLRESGFCSLDIDIEGTDIYLFKGLNGNKPLFE